MKNKIAKFFHKENARPKGKNFRERADAFWSWFAENEEVLSEVVQNRGGTDPDKVVSLISKGADLVMDGLKFNIGGDFEFTFTVDGERYLFYLLPWLVSRMPEQFRGKWHFFPCMQGTHGESFGFGMYGVRADLDAVQVLMDYDPEKDKASLRFYHEGLCGLEEKQCLGTFFIMMDLAIGESMSHIYIGGIERADGPEEGMFPLNELEQRLTDAVKEAGKELCSRPDKIYSAYEFQPRPEVEEPRYDVMSGVTCFMDLPGDYYRGSSETCDSIAGCGAKAAFLWFPYFRKTAGKGDMNDRYDRHELLQTRYELEERLENEVLGKRGSGRENGIVLGGAMGTKRVYIDLLLFDEPAFLEKVRGLLADYPVTFYLSEYRRGSKPEVLSEYQSGSRK